MSSACAHIKQQKDTTLYPKCLLDVTMQYTYWFIASSKYLLSTTPSCLCNCIFPLGLKLNILLVLLISAVIQWLQQQLFSHTKQVPIIYSLLNSLLWKMPLNTFRTGESMHVPASQGQQIQVSCMWQAHTLLFPPINLQMLCPHTHCNFLTCQ